MPGLLSEVLGEKEAAVFFAGKDRDPEFVAKFLELLELDEDDPDYQEARSRLLYIADRKKVKE